MKIQWCGQACFLLTSKEGTRLLTDPFNKHLGYPVPRYLVDGITVSHNHYDHNYVRAVPNHQEIPIMREPGSYQVKEIVIQGVPVFHDNCQGEARGSNNIFVFQLEGIRIAHLGDLGHTFTNQQLENLGSIDILLIPLGGTYTIGYQEANIILDQLQPRIAIPMHYKTPTLRYQLDSLELFLAGKSNVELLTSHELEIAGATMGSSRKIIVFHCF